LRHLSEDEVRQINFILKSRAYRYIAAAKEEWLYPEWFVSKSDWASYGLGYLLMPDPRPIPIGGTVTMGGRGWAMSFDEYGRPPWDKDFEKELKSASEVRSLYRFQSEFAHMMGPCRRGITVELGKLDAEKDTDSMHEYYLHVGEKYGGGRKA
jgi:hypothetical protein